MEVVKKLKVRPILFDISKMDVTWEFVDQATSLDYEVWVERSGGPGGPFSVIAKTYNSIHHADHTANLRGWQQDYYYRLRVVRRDDHEEAQVTEIGTFAADPDIITREIRRRHNLALREFSGVQTLYYPLRHEGARCPECWDDLAQQRCRSHCEVCYDTGYVMGFYNPILIYTQIGVGQFQQANNPETDEFIQRPATGFVPGDIEMHIGDLLVESDNTRWLINGVSLNEKLQAITSNNLTLHKVLESDVLYKIHLPRQDVFSDRFPLREFTRPYTLNPGN